MLPVFRLELRSLRRPHLDESGVRTRPRPRLLQPPRSPRSPASPSTNPGSPPDSSNTAFQIGAALGVAIVSTVASAILQRLAQKCWQSGRVGSGGSRRSRARRPSARGLRWHGWSIGSRTVVLRLPEQMLARSGAIPGERGWIRPRAASRARTVPLAAWPARHDDVLALQLESCSPRLTSRAPERVGRLRAFGRGSGRRAS